MFCYVKERTRACVKIRHVGSGGGACLKIFLNLTQKKLKEHGPTVIGPCKKNEIENNKINS